ncbi:MAG: chromosomal replication initiator protein DnaA, partial [Gammaproteobacteria bacterium]|nr:chromosomal replication initiator protein DnaA [Gammaproteobacteria bacterium]
MSAIFWPTCLKQLEQKLSDQQLNTWIRPLQIKEDENSITLLAPNRFVLDWVKQHFQQQIQAILVDIGAAEVSLNIEIGSQAKAGNAVAEPTTTSPNRPAVFETRKSTSSHQHPIEHNLNPAFTFSSFVEGKSNQL